MKLSEAIEFQIARKQSAGMRYRDVSYTLRAFSRSIGDLQLTDVPTAAVKLFIDAGLSANTRQKRHQRLKLFYDYWFARGEVLLSPVPVDVPKVPNAFVPYIYTHAQIQSLLHATSLSQAKRWCAMSAQTFRTLLLFLYGTGLRLGEALSLEQHQVDLTGTVIKVERTKFYKSRLVPIGRDMNQLLSQHLQRRLEESPSSKVFQTECGKPIVLQTVDLSFRRLRRHVAIARHDVTTYQPRVHDLRHSFAVHRLIAWYQQGKDVQRLLPALSTYLGHVDISSTQRYLTMTPELLQQASKRFEQYAFSGAIYGPQ